MILSYTDICKILKSSITGQVINKQTSLFIQGVAISSNDSQETVLTDKHQTIYLKKDYIYDFFIAM